MNIQKEKILELEATSWRLKSRAVWISLGDANTIFFSEYASARKNVNAIWDLDDGDGNTLVDDLFLQKVGMKHFKQMFEDEGLIQIQENLKVSTLFPSHFTIEETDLIGKIVSIGEIENVLKKFAKDKASGPDSWRVNFFLVFFIWLEMIS